MTTSTHLLACCTLAALAGPFGPTASPQEPTAAEAAVDPVGEAETTVAADIAWFGRWEDARAEAARTGRPILLMSAAPRCSGAPGMW